MDVTKQLALSATRGTNLMWCMLTVDVHSDLVTKPASSLDVKLIVHQEAATTSRASAKPVTATQVQWTTFQFQWSSWQQHSCCISTPIESETTNNFLLDIWYRSAVIVNTILRMFWSFHSQTWYICFYTLVYQPVYMHTDWLEKPLQIQIKMKKI